MKFRMFASTAVVLAAALPMLAQYPQQNYPQNNGQYNNGNRYPNQGGGNGYPGNGYPGGNGGFSRRDVRIVGNQLNPNQSLGPNEAIESPSGLYTMVMQRDCNLVIYRAARNTPFGRPDWASNTDGKGRRCSAIMQSDGNFVVYDENRRAVWSTRTDRRENRNSIVRVGEDGRFVMLSRNREVWSLRR